MNLNLLIVDRDIALAELYRRFLSGEGHSAQTAASELECLDMLRQQSWNALVLDREISRSGAKRVLAFLRNEGLSVPVILTTWNASPDAVRRVVVPPVVLCLRKFFPLTALLEGIRLAVNNRGNQDRISVGLQLIRQGDPP